MIDARSADPPSVNLDRLVHTFYHDVSGSRALAAFEAVESAPEPYDRLLNHNEHMTVTVESHYGQSVDVVVHRTTREGVWYAREITLVTSESRQIVQYGIVRLKTDAVAPAVWQEIEEQKTPLGRVLIEHNVLREVQLCGLWHVQCGQCLASLMHQVIGSIAYGRTALIYCDGEPAIELLEILAPIASP